LSDSTQHLDLISSSQAGKEITANAAFDSMSPAALYGRRAVTSAALTFGYYGGKKRKADGSIASISNGTISLTASATNYLYATDAGVVTKATSAPAGWPGPLASDATALYEIVTSGGAITSYTDYRTMGGAGGGSVAADDVSITDAGGYFTGTDVEAALQEIGLALDGAGTGDVVGPASSTDSHFAQFDGTTGKLLKGGIALDTDATLAANSNTKLASQAAVKSYVDGKVAGLSWKQAVRAATTVAGTLASSFENGDAIDGVTLATGDRILIKNQATASENGIYVVAASGAPTRATDADAGAELVNATVYVSDGTTLADTQWTCTNNATITLGSTGLAFAQLSAGGGSSSSITGTTGAAGGNATVTGGISTTAGNAGGQSVIVGGTPGTNGVGGAVAITGAAGGTSAGAGGAVNITGGAGTANPSNGGNVNITAGAQGPGVGVGGSVAITGGAFTGVTISGSSGVDSRGPVSITGGSGQSGTGGAVTLAGGSSSSIATAGACTVRGGDGGNPGACTVRGGDGTDGFGSAGAACTVRGGNSLWSSGGGSVSPGALNLTGGGATGVGNNAGGAAVNITGGAGGAGGSASAGGGAVVLIGGAAGANNKSGGNVTFKGGAGVGTGTQGNVGVDNGAALATTTAGGFLCIPSCAGTPTGTPANVPTGSVPVVLDTTNGRLYAYYGAAWHQVTLT
jgi:hypothetical protein